MACKTCSHTMKTIGQFAGEPIHYCWRCGTIADASGSEVPTVIRQIRKLSFDYADDERVYDLLRRYGLIESTTCEVCDDVSATTRTD
jgi:hypothetical protein